MVGRTLLKSGGKRGAQTRLDAELLACSRSTTANYLHFYEAMNTILSSGYHHLLIPKLQDYIEVLRPADAEACIEMEFRKKMGDTLSPEEQQAAQLFRMFKLIIGYFRR